MSRSKQNEIKRWALVSISFIFCFSGLSPAQAANYTITYDANAGYVGAVAQAGITTGSVPNSSSVAQGTIVTVAAQGNLARQGFTFVGWNDRQDGTGITYTAGSGTFTLGAGNVTLWAKWSVPTAARLIGNGGSIISVSNPNNVANGTVCTGKGIRGITSDGTNIIFRPSQTTGNSPYICVATPAGVLVSVNSVTGLSAVTADQLALVYGNGCLFLRKDTMTTLSSIYCIAINDWSLNSVTLNGANLPVGGFWLYGNFIQFPDGRIGSVGMSVAAASWPGGVGTGVGQCPSGMYCKSLRLFNVSGTGASVTTSYSAEYVLADFALSDNTSWPSDDHGIATDGTYLYQVRHARGYKVWALSSIGPSYLVFNGDADGLSATTPACGASTGVTGSFCQITYPVNGAAGGGALANSTFFGRAHGLNKYLVGDYGGSSTFWLSDAATPPPGPGNADLTPPSFTNSDTFTVTENVATTFNSATITANESSTITVGAGIDGSLFNIVRSDSLTAYVRFKVSPDYEGPTDVGTNNIYNFTITVTDTSGNSASRTFAIVVTNLNENSITGTPTVSGNVYKGIMITLSVVVNAPGKVRFFMDGKRIANCLAVPTSGSYPNYTASCSWKPAVTAQHQVTATLTPSDNTFASSTSQVGSFWVLKRTGLR